MLIHWIWYATLPKLSTRQKLALLEVFSKPEDIYYTEHFDHIPGLTAETAEILSNKDLTQARAIVRACEDKQVGILTMADAGYPEQLRNISTPPLVLYYKGILPDFEGQPVISVVGTRKATAYGINNARAFSRQIAQCGGLVVSGGAAGIDSAALEGALSAGRPVVAVLGCGVNVVYPKRNRNLFARIAQNGCLISEYLPDSEPKPWQFPERNRIISGLSCGVLVVEAPVKSGALITARNAFEQGRDVYAIPGNIGMPACAGSNALLQEFAGAVFSGWDVLKAYASDYPHLGENHDLRQPDHPLLQVAQPREFPLVEESADKKLIDNPDNNAYIDLENIPAVLSEQETDILSYLTNQAQPVDDIIARVEMPAAMVLGILTKLSLKGLVIQHPGRLVSKVDGGNHGKWS